MHSELTQKQGIVYWKSAAANGMAGKPWIKLRPGQDAELWEAARGVFGGTEKFADVAATARLLGSMGDYRERADQAGDSMAIDDVKATSYVAQPTAAQAARLLPLVFEYQAARPKDHTPEVSIWLMPDGQLLRVRVVFHYVDPNYALHNRDEQVDVEYSGWGTAEKVSAPAAHLIYNNFTLAP
jgi:hypothetical protein